MGNYLLYIGKVTILKLGVEFYLGDDVHLYVTSYGVGIWWAAGGPLE